MSFKSGYFCGFCQKEGTAESMKNCPRCQIATYCNDTCKNQDWNSHKDICQKIKYLQDLIPRIERNFYDFDLVIIEDGSGPPPAVMAQMMAAMKEMKMARKRSQGNYDSDSDDEYELGPQNLFETRYVQFCTILFMKPN